MLMGELGVASEDRQRYLKDGFSLVTAELTGKLDQWVKEVEAQGISFKGWAMPGGGGRADDAAWKCRGSTAAGKKSESASSGSGDELAAGCFHWRK